MPPQFVGLHLGGCGSGLGLAQWDILAAEHAVAADGQAQPAAHDAAALGRGVMFAEGPNDRWVPRAVFADTDANSASDVVRRGFDPAACLTCPAGVGVGNAAAAHYGVGAALRDPLIDALRRRVESCDTAGGFVVTCGLGGGAGSGLLLQTEGLLHEEFRGTGIVHTFCVMPESPAAGSSDVVAPYNTVLGLAQLSDARFVTLVNNSGLQRHVASATSLAALNRAAAQCLVDTTASARLPSPDIPATSLLSLANALTPYPRVHFNRPARVAYDSGDVPDSESLVRAVLSSDRALLRRSEPQRAWIAAALLQRGPRAATYDTTSTFYRVVDSAIEGIFYTSTAPVACTAASRHVPACDGTDVVTSLVSGSWMGDELLDWGNAFTCMFRRKAFLAPYVAEGMDEMEFTEAESTVNDLMWDCRAAFSHCPEMCEEDGGE